MPIARSLKLPIVVAALLAFILIARAGQIRVAVLDFTPESTTAAAGDWTVGLEDFVEVALQKEAWRLWNGGKSGLC